MGGRALILLDTHVLVWLDQGIDKLGPESRRRADEAHQSEKLAVSAISFWEIAMLVGKSRIDIEQPLSVWRRSLLDLGMRELPLDGEIGIAATALESLHDDPADRMIVASALRFGAVLMTADRAILDWPGRLTRIDARQ